MARASGVGLRHAGPGRTIACRRRPYDRAPGHSAHPRLGCRAEPSAPREPSPSTLGTKTAAGSWRGPGTCGGWIYPSGMRRWSCARYTLVQGMTLVHCNTATDGPLGSQQEQTREDDGQGCPHEGTTAGARGCTSGRINTGAPVLPLQWPHEYPWATARHHPRALQPRLCPRPQHSSSSVRSLARR